MKAVVYLFRCKLSRRFDRLLADPFRCRLLRRYDNMLADLFGDKLFSQRKTAFGYITQHILQKLLAVQSRCVPRWNARGVFPKTVLKTFFSDGLFFAFSRVFARSFSRSLWPFCSRFVSSWLGSRNGPTRSLLTGLFVACFGWSSLEKWSGFSSRKAGWEETLFCEENRGKRWDTLGWDRPWFWLVICRKKGFFKSRARSSNTCPCTYRESGSKSLLRRV